ncbi:MAG: M24 family metallopeptidase, partial [Spirochaetes bacterium]|nr:M24 family metallopeptidase [Spirochaetota bacterium]
PNYGKKGTGVRLKPGMVLAIEPMVSIGTDEVLIRENNWTVITADSSLAAHFEHTIAVTDNGPVILTI